MYSGGDAMKNINFFDFQKLFSTEKKCYRYLFKTRWPNGFICPKCGCMEYSYIKTRSLYQCKSCRYQCSLTAGTVFHKTRTPLVKLFWMVFFIAHDKNGHSALDLTRKLNISYKVAWSMCHKIREAMIEHDRKYQLAGLIELDDSYFGGKKASGPRGRGALNKVPVIVAAQLTEDYRPQYASMTVVENMKEENIKKTAQENITSGSTIKSDAYSSLGTLKKYGYDHKPEVIGDPKNASKLLPWVHIFISNAKSNIRGTYKGVSNKYLQRYLSAFCYRLNRRYTLDLIFNKLLSACADKSPITLAELKA